MVFSLTLQQTGILLIFIFIGFFLRRREIITESGKKVLAGLLVNLFLPCYYLESLSRNLSIEKINEYLVYFLVGIGFAIAIVFIAIPFARLVGKGKLQRNILKYCFTFSNIGYFGYPVVGAVFGEVVKASMIIFCIPQTFVISTYGYQILTQKIEEPEDLQNTFSQRKKWTQNLNFLYAPPFLSVILGVILGLLPIQMPSFIVGILEKGASCSSTVAMILTGAVLSTIPLVKLIGSIKPYVVGILRLIVLPAIIGGIIYLLGARGDLLKVAIASVSLPVGMNVVVYPESSGQDSSEGAKMCFVSYLLALATVPLVFQILQMLA